jgi:hypothetical protein
MERRAVGDRPILHVPGANDDTQWDRKRRRQGRGMQSHRDLGGRKHDIQVPPERPGMVSGVVTDDPGKQMGAAGQIRGGIPDDGAVTNHDPAVLELAVKVELE